MKKNETEKKMVELTNEVMKMITKAMKEQGKSGEEIAKMEIAIQYLGNSDFRDNLNNYVFEETYQN